MPRLVVDSKGAWPEARAIFPALRGSVAFCDAPAIASIRFATAQRAVQTGRRRQNLALTGSWSCGSCQVRMAWQVHMQLEIEPGRRWIGCGRAVREAMTVAIPVAEGRISPVLDSAARLLIVARTRGRDSSRRECVIAPLSAEAMARSIADLKVDVVLCAALSESLRYRLETNGVRVRRHLCGEVELVLRAFLGGCLRQAEFRMPGCSGWHVDGACRRGPAKRGATSTKVAPSAKGSPA